MASTGQKLGRYELISLTSGERWLARQDGVDKRVEIRILSGADAESQLAHARTIAQLEHANLARVIDLGEDHGERYVVTEIVDGVTLAELLALPQRLDELGVTRVIADACEGIDAAHDHGDGLVHGGVSPSTIGVLFSGQVKVSALDVTAPGPTAYTAPERLDGGPGDPRSDVFSLGVVLWEALTHERLFDGSTEDATRKMVRELQIESPAMLNANVPAPLADVCMRALAANPDVRHPSAKQLAVELEAVLTQAGYSRRNEGIAKFVGEAFPDRASARKRKTTLPPDTAVITAPVVVPAAAIAAAPAPKPIALFPRTTPLPIAMPSVVPAVAAKPVQQTMVMPPPSVRPATPSQPPQPIVHTMQMPAMPESSIVPALSPAKSEPAKSEPAKAEPAKPVLPKPKSSPSIAPKAAKQDAAEELPTTRIERPTIEAVMAPPPLAHQTPMPPVIPARDPTPNPMAAVSLPDRPSVDVIGGWGWKTDSMPALSDGGDELDEPMAPPSRKPLMFVFGGALAVAALVSIIALASGGSEEPPAKPGAAKVAEQPANEAATPTPPTPTPPATATPIVAAATLPDDAAVAEPALSAPIDAEPPPPPDAAPPPPPDAAPPPIDAAPPPPPPPDAAVPPPKPVAVIAPPPPPKPETGRDREAQAGGRREADRQAQAAPETERRGQADRSVREAGVRRRGRESLGPAAIRARRYRRRAVDAARLARIEPELRTDLALARPHLPEARRTRSGARRVQALLATRPQRR